MDEKYFFQKNGWVEMFLPGKAYKERRRIGRCLDDTYYTKRNNRAIFRKIAGGGIGLPYNLIKDGDFDFVEVTIMPEGRVLRTSRASILEFGIFLNYDSHDLERQIIMPISDFGREPLKRKPAKIETPSLFDEVAA